LDLSISLPYFQSASHDVYKQMKIVQTCLLNKRTTSNILNTWSDMTFRQLHWDLSDYRDYCRNPTHNFVALYMSPLRYGMQCPIILTSVVKLHVYSPEWACSCSHWFIWNACVLLHVTRHNIYQKQLL
jgi:hypothetical protein